MGEVQGAHTRQPDHEPENPDYPKKPEFKEKFGPRGVIHSWPRPDGTQKIKTPAH